MCSSGIGGSNGHVVLEGPPRIEHPRSEPFAPTAPVLIMSGGLSPRTAGAVATSIEEILAQHDDLALIGTLYGRRVRGMTWRSFAIATPGQALKFSQPILGPRTKPPVAFVFSGQGPQHINSMHPSDIFLRGSKLNLLSFSGKTAFPRLPSLPGQRPGHGQNL